MVGHGWRTARALFGGKFWIVLSVAALLMFLEVALSGAADETKVKAGTVQVVDGAISFAQSVTAVFGSMSNR